MIVVGVDLSGPSNTADTAVTIFRGDNHSLQLTQSIEGATDKDIFELTRGIPAKQDMIVGLDAPLSYNPGGGDRISDRSLRQALVASGMKSGCVMTPTSTRMAYLTLRGISVARLLESMKRPGLKIVEVHPGGAMALGGAPIQDVRELKREPLARQRLVTWLEEQGLQGVLSHLDPSDHFVASCACALSAWRWFRGSTSWISMANDPHHPYDFAC